MSEPTVVVLPALGDGQKPADIASAIQHALHEKANPEPDRPGPFKQMLAQPDSLYQYINWEDPIRTLGVYIGALSILFGAHYLPLTQVVLKAGVTTFGVVSVTEFASRSFSTNSLSTRLRPKEYKKIPESTLNATLKDVHDFVQYALVQAQRIVFGQDLDKTFAAFLGCTTLYWLTRILSPFWLTVMGLTSIFVAPLVSSPQGHGAAHDVSVRARELAKTATEKGAVLAQNSKASAAELSSKGQQMAAGLSTQAKGTASDMSGTAAESINKLPQKGMNAVNEAPGIVASAFRDAKGYITTSPSNNVAGNYDGDQSITGGLGNKASHLSSSISRTAKHMVPGVRAEERSEADRLQNAHSTVPAQTAGQSTGFVADTDIKNAVTGDVAAMYGSFDRDEIARARMDGRNLGM